MSSGDIFDVNRELGLYSRDFMLRRIFEPLSNDKEFMKPDYDVIPLQAFPYLIKKIKKYYQPLFNIGIDAIRKFNYFFR